MVTRRFLTRGTSGKPMQRGTEQKAELDIAVFGGALQRGILIARETSCQARSALHDATCGSSLAIGKPRRACRKVAGSCSFSMKFEQMSTSVHGLDSCQLPVGSRQCEGSRTAGHTEGWGAAWRLACMVHGPRSIHGPRTTRWESVTLAVVRHAQGMSRQRHAARWLRFPARFGAVPPQVIMEPQVAHLGFGFVFHLFLRRSNSAVPQRRSEGGSGPHRPTVQPRFSTYSCIFAQPTNRRGGEIAHNRRDRSACCRWRDLPARGPHRFSESELPRRRRHSSIISMRYIRRTLAVSSAICSRFP